VKHVLNKS